MANRAELIHWVNMLRAENEALRQQRDALLAFAQDFKAFVSRDDYPFLGNDEYARYVNALADKMMAALTLVHDE